MVVYILRQVEERTRRIHIVKTLLNASQSCFCLPYLPRLCKHGFLWNAADDQASSGLWLVVTSFYFLLLQFTF